jgi:hypothetical protein
MYRGYFLLIIIIRTCVGNMRFPSQYSDCSKGGTIQGSNPGNSKGFFFSPKHSDRLWGLPAYHPKGTAVQSWDTSGRGVKLTTHLHLVPRLRVSGAIPLLPLYAFMPWTCKTTYLMDMKNMTSIKLFFSCLFRHRF